MSHTPCLPLVSLADRPALNSHHWLSQKLPLVIAFLEYHVVLNGSLQTLKVMEHLYLSNMGEKHFTATQSASTSDIIHCCSHSGMRNYIQAKLF